MSIRMNTEDVIARGQAIGSLNLLYRIQAGLYVPGRHLLLCLLFQR